MDSGEIAVAHHDAPSMSAVHEAMEGTHLPGDVVEGMVVAESHAGDAVTPDEEEDGHRPTYDQYIAEVMKVHTERGNEGVHYMAAKLQINVSTVYKWNF